MLCKCRRSILTWRDKEVKKRWRRSEGEKMNRRIVWIVSRLANLFSIVPFERSVSARVKMFRDHSFFFLFSPFILFLFSFFLSFPFHPEQKGLGERTQKIWRNGGILLRAHEINLRENRGRRFGGDLNI